MPQKQRAAASVVYLGVLIGVTLATSQLPTFDYRGTWFWAGALLLILLTALVEPLFPTPGDAVANASAVILATAAFPSQEHGELMVPAGTLLAGRIVVVVVAMVPLLSGLIIIATKRHPPRVHVERPWETFLRRIATTVGSARVMYSVVFLASSLAVMHQRVEDLAALWVAWLVIIVGKPLEWLYLNWPRTSGKAASETVAVVALRDPGLVELESREALEPGMLIAVEDSTLEVVDRSRSEDGTWAVAVLADGELPRIGSTASLVGHAEVSALGFVDSGTDLSEVSFTVGPHSPPLNYGDLVTAEIQGAEVLYQVVEAEIRVSRVEANISHSDVRVKATKLGVWDDTSERFRSAGWLPRPGSAVRQLPVAAPVIRSDAIGHVPGTSFSIRADLNTLVTHGSAILGVLGSGKSTFAKELVRRIVKSGCKVLVIDTTPEYAEDLDDFVKAHPDAIANRVNASIVGTAAVKDKTKELGGNRRDFAREIRRDVSDFLDSADPVCVYDITKFQVTKQVTGVDYKTGEAGHDYCTLPELTAIISREILELLRNKRSDVARLCVVLEEGHYLVPEFTSVSAKDDEKAVAQTAKVFLQGRKFGLGPLLVTQRTANVSKSLLTQANTTFCFRAHDDTTAGFLRERAGASHIKALAKLEDRRMLALGRGISCDDPLFLTVNDYESIVRVLADDGGQGRLPFPSAPIEDPSKSGAIFDPTVPDDPATDPVDHWSSILLAVRSRSRRVHALLKGASASLQDGTVHIAASSEFHAQALSEPTNSRVVGDAIREVTGAEPNITVSASDGGA